MIAAIRDWLPSKLEIKKMMGRDDVTPYEAGTLVPKRPHLADLNNVKQPKACVGALDMDL